MAEGARYRAPPSPIGAFFAQDATGRQPRSHSFLPGSSYPWLAGNCAFDLILRLDGLGVALGTDNAAE